MPSSLKNTIAVGIKLKGFVSESTAIRCWARAVMPGSPQNTDSRGNQVGFAFFGPDQKPILSKDGAAAIAQKFDSRGELVEQASFGVDGKPVMSFWGYSFAEIGAMNVVVCAVSCTTVQAMHRLSVKIFLVHNRKTLTSILGEWRSTILSGVHSKAVLDHIPTNRILPFGARI